MRLNNRSFFIQLSLIWAVAYGAAIDAHCHEGHVHGPQGEAGTVKDGKLAGKDGLSYLDAGRAIFFGSIELRQRISNENRILYQSNYENPRWDRRAEDEKLSLKVPGGHLLKAFKFDNLPGIIEPLQIIVPVLSTEIEISKSKETKIEWLASDRPNTQIQIVIEVFDSERPERSVIGRLIVDAKDDGLFIIKPEILSKLSIGKAEIAIKRQTFSGLKRQGGSGLITFRSVDTKIARGRVID